MHRESKYNFLIESADDHLLLYNSRTGAFASLPLSQRPQVEEILSLEDKNVDRELKEALVHGGFLVPASLDELDEIKNRFFTFKNDKKAMRLAMLASEDCNFRCPYCFVYERRGFNMKEWVYDATLKLIERSATDDFCLRISWFGGEPTLAERQILNFMKKLNAMGSRRKFRSLKYSMVTNGYLLTKQSVERYLDEGLDSFQVTLDGDAASHDRTRVLRDGRGTFDVIWDNLISIKEIERNLEMSVRANFLKNRDAEMQSLIDKFSDQFGGDKRYVLYFRPVYNFETGRQDICQLKSEVFSLEDGIHKQMDYNIGAARESGRVLSDVRMVNPVPKPIPAWCNAEKDNFWLVGADGLLFKCDSLFGEEDKACARLREDGTIDPLDDAYGWGRSIYDEGRTKCLDCRLLPICQGGCARRRRTQPDSCYLNEKVLTSAMLRVHEFYQDKEAD